MPGTLSLQILLSQDPQKTVEVVEEWFCDFGRQRLSDGVLGSVRGSGSSRNTPELRYAGVTKLVRHLGQEQLPAGDASLPRGAKQKLGVASGR